MDNEATSMGRRRFLNWFLGTSVGALMGSILFPVARFVSPPEVPEAATNQVEACATNDPELLEKGFRIIRFGLEPVLLMRVAEGDFRAYTATCTHLDCIVEYQKGEGRIWCNCHNGHYDLSGQVVAGPPPRPLDPIEVNLVSAGPGLPQKIVLSRA